MLTRRDVFQGIADPTRRAIVQLVSKEPLSISTVADKFNLSQPAISKHIKILVECQLLEIRVKGRERLCQTNIKRLDEISLWVEQCRSFWNVALDNLENLLSESDEKN